MRPTDPAARRHLGAGHGDHDELGARWRELLDLVERSPDRGSTGRAGHPTRRQALRAGGIGLVGAAVLAACSDDDGSDGATTSPPPTDEDDADDEPIGDAERDVVLANTALSLEVLLTDTYRSVLDGGRLETAAVRDAVARFEQHHLEHRGVLVAVVESAGEEPFLVANPVVKAAMVDPLLLAATSEGDIVRLAHDLEQAAAQLYVHAAIALSSPALRSTAIRVAGIESRHGAVLHALGELSSPRPAAYPTANPLPREATVTG